MAKHSLALLGWSAIAAAQATFNWSSITPSSDLEYHDCLAGHKCARLLLPLDYQNKSDTRTVANAIIKRPAAVAEDDPAFGGTILTNPGGPDASGVTFIPRIGYTLQQIADKPGKKHYEILSWDPRGVGETTPVVDCYKGFQVSRDGDTIQNRATGGLANGQSALAYNYALYDGYSQMCERADEEQGPLFGYMGTPAVVGDMLGIIDKVDELRKSNNAKRGMARRKDDGNGDEKARLKYIGFSYGTVLGNYFASMFPGRLDRMVLDGVVDTGWLTGVEDMDNLFDEFFEGCFNHTSLCALARDSDTSPSDIKDRVWSAIDALEDRPVGAPHPSTGSSVVVTSPDVRSVLGTSAYAPATAFKSLGAVLDNMVNGNFSQVIASMTALRSTSPMVDGCPGQQLQTSVIPHLEANSGVVCTDGSDVRDKGLDYWQDYVDTLAASSRVYGDLWAVIRFPCGNWRFKPHWKFNGPWTSPDPDPDRVEGKPTAGILFLSSRLDPVAPLSSARRMSGDHAGSAVVMQDSLGHAALTSAPSNCTRGIVADYFDTGKLPSNNTVCPQDCGPWDAEPCVAITPPPSSSSSASNEKRSSGVSSVDGLLDMLSRRQAQGLRSVVA